MTLLRLLLSLHYEHGGIGHHDHLVVLDKSSNRWKIVYSARSFYEHDTLTKLRNAIRRGKFELNTDDEL
jgi:hypothetical protein